jgi:hypothetical protein
VNLSSAGLANFVEFAQQLGTVMLLYPPLRLLRDFKRSASLKNTAATAQDPRRRGVLMGASKRIVEQWRPHYLWVTVAGTLLVGATALFKLGTLTIEILLS